MLTFTLNGNDYQCAPINAREQFHVIRRLSPAIAELAGALEKDAPLETTLKSLGRALASLSDDDADYCLFGLLKGVERKQQGTGWVKITVDKTVMFPDLTMVDLLQIAGRSFKVNFGSFFDYLPQGVAQTAAGG